MFLQSNAFEDIQDDITIKCRNGGCSVAECTNICGQSWENQRNLKACLKIYY